MDRTQKIRERAYELWNKSGQPTGMELEHWRLACVELGIDPDELDKEAATEVGGGERAAAFARGEPGSDEPKPS